MYEGFFHFNVKPFDLVPNPDFLFLSKSHKKALTYLDYGIRERVGFILLTGEVGSGKTTIIRNLIKKHHDEVVISMVYNTKVNSEQLFSMINDDFGISTACKDKTGMLRDLNEFLVEQYARGNSPVLIIDEAQNLTSKLLEEIRMLSNLETDNSKLLQIVLVGQPELRDTISAPSMRQLRQRISINCHLQPLTRSELEKYIYHRLEVAGNRDAVTVSPESFDLIFSASRGIPRIVNVICDFLLISAFAEETHNLDALLVREVIEELDVDHHFQQDDNVDKVCQSRSAISSDKVFSYDANQMLQSIIQRLDYIEREGRNNTELIFREFGQKLTELQNAFMFHVKETDSAMISLNAKLEKVRSAVDEAGLESGRANNSIVKKILGG